MVLNKLKFSCFSKADLTSLDLHVRWNTITAPISTVLESKGRAAGNAWQPHQRGMEGALLWGVSKSSQSKELMPPTHSHPSQANIRHKSAFSPWPHVQHHTACVVCYPLTTGEKIKWRKQGNCTVGKIIFPHVCMWDDSAISANASDGLSIEWEQVGIFSAGNCSVFSCIATNIFFFLCFPSSELMDPC